ncbi:NAD(P)/FAD-dependent oxidoreductase [Arthrobacter gengyunqii]|uniref:NAD(P)/FAD-dependent oxidoreductase n=1 Tax=Arthrobacter gengyunqii TaxID=2886940 RepID=A0A9X1M0P7_9MICC|nr:NAD(P)/FAD-dependent oxidoreductase [Arthrobacter gengyunqii]MCC3268757.1 NAD(P)/FAD-dependent oxidoreductase [Arthrobacter gengyunqii]UOY96141.1 NAD(P)/FAD-dependent oxidoreductase [Arthrobacter gengyunqii]
MTYSPAAVQAPQDSVVDDLYWRDEYSQITEDDAFLRNIVETSDLPALLVALAAVTRDFSLLRPNLRPPQPPADTIGQPHGGMSQEAQMEARELAFQALRRVRDEQLTRVETLDEDQATSILEWITNAASPEYHPFLMHDMALAEGKSGKPRWNYEDISAGREFSVAIIGSGVSGMAAAYRFGQANIPYTVFEKGNAVGGTWWKNTYPGVRLDTPNYAYSFSFAQRDDWPQQFSEGPEIHAYTCEVARRGGIEENIQFGTEVTSAAYDEATGLWTVEMIVDGEQVSRRFNAVVSAVGQLDRPKFPDVPGRTDFAGIHMHSAEWDNDVDVTGKRVAVIGTGASAYQIVPAVVDQVESLTVFQRSSPWMLPTNGYYDDMPDSVKWLVEHLPHYGQWMRFWQYWLGVEGRQHTMNVEDGWNTPGSVSAINERVRQELTRLLEVQYQDRPDLLAKVTPDYIVGGKRMLRDNGVWAESLKKPQTTLVTSGMERMTENGIIDADGVFHELDMIIYATGFHASEFLEPLQITGRNGRDLHEYWGGDAKAFAGITVPNFPNLFILTGPNTGHVVNGSLFTMMESAIEYTLEAFRHLLEENLKALDLKQEVLDAFVRDLDAANSKKAWGHPSVNTWYKNKFGRVSQIWPYPVLDYWKITRRVNLDDYNKLS